MDTLEQNEKNDSVTSLVPASRSIVPDTLKELPEWYTKDNWSGTTSFRVRFPLHNPFGPRYYQNHHLIPPSMYRPGARPPSIFSPSFPAMGTNSMPERTDDNAGPTGPSRTPSHSPLPTPSSSQTRVADLGIKPRSRKTSQTAHDNVDLLDVSDPWGTNWHHESPYDIGMGSSPVTADADQSRSRRSSMTTQARRKTVTPSPLSQSTSALHLQAPLAEGSHMPRKLSKRRGLSGIFGSHGKSHQLASQSLPASPVADIVPSQPPPPLEDRSKRASTMPPVNKSVSAITKERRGSILGRLTKRFSVTRKPSAHDGHPHTDDHSVEFPSALHKSSEKNSKRVPPPSVENIEVPEIPLKTLHDTDRRSSISVDDVPTTGKLMVANPDAPSEISTPPQVEALLPVQQTNITDQYWQSAEKRSSNLHMQSPSLMTSLNSSVQAQTSDSIPSTSSPLNGHVHSPDSSTNMPPPASSHGHGRAYSSQRQSFDDKPLPKPLERVTSPAPSNGRRPEENRRPRSPERGPPPPSSTTKPIPLPEVSAAPPPPSVTTKPIPLPSTVTPLPPSTTTPRMTKDIPLPVPSSSQLRDQPVSHSTSHLSISQAAVEDSPLSAASLLVNPPTPHVADDTLLHSESTPAIKRSSSREPSPGISSVTVRETETFKLVRTKSGNVQTVSEIIPAAGEQWEVVEEPSPTKRSSKSRDKDRSSSSRSDREHVEKGRDSRRDSRKQEKEKERKAVEAVEIEEGSDRHGNRSSRSHSHKHSVDDIPRTEYSSKAIGRSSSMDSHHRSPLPDYMRQHEETRSGRTRDDGRRNRKTSKSHSASPTKPSSSSRPLERASSKTTRPTSEVPPAADLTALRAREAWDMERLHKGRSMYGNDQNGETVALVAAPTAVPVSSSLPKGPIGPTTTNKSNGALHGSSHTSFVVQNFGNQGATHIYHSMPTQPPPIIYGSTSLPTGHTVSNVSLPPRASSTSVVSPPPLSSSPRTSSLINSASSDFLINRTPNPLPEPPRETHTPPRISQTFSDTNTAKTGRPAEYWTTYAAAEVTTAH
ncbi:hypothetical protein BDP27DRAFT_1313850 [Rhodocollybia butyracea]|uniref:Uncharacterized protein n=1 Tax=Rhodocollybia butyracea TaxID=206335 RepID=A0A9P5UF79_9AGAR|nr:hypothetical protein BDP27DRAFT_1313850 [Rhodocollybia butyracea]